VVQTRREPWAGWRGPLAGGLCGLLGGVLSPDAVEYVGWDEAMKPLAIGLITAIAMAALLPLLALLQRR
jgi:hypothetical protein